MVLVDLVKMLASSVESLLCSFRVKRSAESCMGVRGLRISCANRVATSPQAASFCALTSVVMSSNTSIMSLSFSSGSLMVLPDKMRVSSGAL